MNIVKAILIGLLCVFILYITVGYFLMLKVNYAGYYYWWNNYGGSKYKGKFQITQIFCAELIPPVFSYINYYLLTSEAGRLTVKQSQFLMSEVLKYIYSVGPDGIPTGVVLPKHMCESIKTVKGDNDAIYDNWIDNATRFAVSNKTANSSGITTILDDTIPLTGYELIDVGRANNVDRYVYYFNKSGVTTTDGKHYSGVYPSNTALQDWKGLILEWLNGTSKWTQDMIQDSAGSSGKPGAWWVWSKSEQDKNIYMLVAPDPDKFKPNGTDVAGIYDCWFGINGQPVRGDNFLGRVRILPEVQLVICFVNNVSTINGADCNPQAFIDLLGESTSSSGYVIGGWFKMLMNMDDNIAANYYNEIKDKLPISALEPECKKQVKFPATLTKLSTWKNIGISVGISAGVAALGCLAIVAGPEVLVGGSTITGWLGAQVVPTAIGAFASSGVMDLGTVPSCDKYY